MKKTLHLYLIIKSIKINWKIKKILSWKIREKWYLTIKKWKKHDYLWFLIWSENLSKLIEKLKKILSWKTTIQEKEKIYIKVFQKINMKRNQENKNVKIKKLIISIKKIEVAKQLRYINRNHNLIK